MPEGYPGVKYEAGEVLFKPGPIDVHAHPRVGDSITDIAYAVGNQHEGKAGLPAYTETALASGIVAIHAMPNESIRFYNPDAEDGSFTETVSFPISNYDRSLFMERAISMESRIMASYYLGLDPAKTERHDGSLYEDLGYHLKSGGERAKGLKIYGAETTGNQNVSIDAIPTITEMWFERYPEKPVIMHLEDANVRDVLEKIAERRNGNKIPVHIAHVSSRQELEAVIWAKERGMNVTCEVTPHHLFATEESRSLVGSYGCMKPSLKSEDDVKFLWDNMEYIDIFASDCAPHRTSDKEGGGTIWGVANHTVMIPLLLGAAEEGRLGIEDIYQKMVVAPRERFNLPAYDGSEVVFSVRESWQMVAEIEAQLNPKYGQNMFLKLEERGKVFHLAGNLEYAHSNGSTVRRDAGQLVTKYVTNLSHLRV